MATKVPGLLERLGICVLWQTHLLSDCTSQAWLSHSFPCCVVRFRFPSRKAGLALEHGPHPRHNRWRGPGPPCSRHSASNRLWRSCRGHGPWPGPGVPDGPTLASSIIREVIICPISNSSRCGKNRRPGREEASVMSNSRHF